MLHNEKHIYSEYTKRVDEYFSSDEPFKEKYRLGYHLSPPVAWLNDPNGLVYENGTYHIYYQFSAPFFENCTWAHITTKDFIHYTYQPLAIYPEDGEGIWSGSAVFDKENVTGLFDAEGGLIAVYTRFRISDNHQRVEIASSRDGKWYTRYPLNPVIANEQNIWAFRDPKTFWYPETGKWITIVAGGIVRFYSSSDLLHWTFESECPDIDTECPDIFPLPLNGDPSNIKWVLSMAGRYYIVGEFDGHRFKPLTQKIPMNGGADCYASQTFDNTPDGRRICISWMDCWENVNRPYQSLSLPLQLTLKSGNDEMMRLFQMPIAEMNALRTEEWTLDSVEVSSDRSFECPIRSELCEIHIEVECGSHEYHEIQIKVLKTGDECTIIGFRPESSEVFVDRSHSGLKDYTAKCPEVFTCPVTPSQTICLDIWVDCGSVEVFANKDEQLISALVFPIGCDGGITVEVVGGTANIKNMSIYKLKPFALEKGNLHQEWAEANN